MVFKKNDVGYPQRNLTSAETHFALGKQQGPVNRQPPTADANTDNAKDRQGSDGLALSQGSTTRAHRTPPPSTQSAPRRPPAPPGKVCTFASQPLAPTSPSGRGAVAMATGPHPTPPHPHPACAGRAAAPRPLGRAPAGSGTGAAQPWKEGTQRAGEDEEVRKAEVVRLLSWGQA